MSVHIDKDFWKNYEENEELIRRCFSHLYYRKYPVSEGSESAYNFLVAEFFRKGIFEKFDEEKEGKYQQTTIKDKTARKKFEQFIYKWSESIMHALYHSHRKNSERYLKFPNMSMDSFNSNSYKTFKENNGITPWSSGDDKEDKVSNRPKIPNISDAEEYHAESPLDALEGYLEKEMYSCLDSILKDDRERLIIKSKKEGLSNSVTAEIVGISTCQVYNILKDIRKRFSKVLA